MNRNAKNKKTAILAACLLLSLSLSACNADKTVVFTPYWNSDINTPQDGIYQKLEYDVTFEKSSAIVDYLVDYNNGKYVTELKTQSLEDGSIIYCYTTELTINATYTYKGESFTSTDTNKSSVLFKLAKNGLKPISSTKMIIGSTPLNREADNLENCYALLNYSISTTYNEDLSKGEMTLVSVNEKGEENSYSDTFAIDKKYTYLDNEQLLFAIRGVNPLENSSPSFSVYSPFVETVQTIDVKYSASKGQDFKFTLNGEEKATTVQYYPVTIAINAKNPGATQTAWYASYKNSPAFRNVLLHLETPISYGLGTLVYSLTNITFED